MPIPVEQCPADTPELHGTSMRVLHRNVWYDTSPTIKCLYWGWRCRVCGAEWWMIEGLPWGWLEEHKHGQTNASNER